MPAITPQFVFDLESRMQLITETEYNRLTQNLWWQQIAKRRPSQSRREIMTWLLSTALITDQGTTGGNMRFDDLVSIYTEFVNKHAGTGLRLDKSQFTDLDGNGLNLAADWSSQIGAQMAYWPQKSVCKAVLAGESGIGYDGKPFFATDHPLNPFRTEIGTYANLFTGSADGIYPGACKIDASVSVDVALENIAKVVAYIQSIKMPNGEDPRMLRPKGILLPPALRTRGVQLTNAKFISQGNAGSTGGTGDVQAVIADLGFAAPTIVDEFGSAFTGGSDTSWYLACEQIAASQVGALIYSDREPFAIRYYTGAGGGNGVDAILNRSDELEWTVKGRNVVQYGHPYMLFKIKAT